jgi:oxygen-independent coproporphyrinogen-3 oxidase
LENWISKGKVKSPKEEEQNREFYYLSDFLKDNGFEHYEVSNFAKPGFIPDTILRIGNIRNTLE